MTAGQLSLRAAIGACGAIARSHRGDNLHCVFERDHEVTLDILKAFGPPVALDIRTTGERLRRRAARGAIEKDAAGRWRVAGRALRRRRRHDGGAGSRSHRSYEGTQTTLNSVPPHAVQPPLTAPLGQAVCGVTRRAAALLLGARRRASVHAASQLSREPGARTNKNAHSAEMTAAPAPNRHAIW